MTLKRLWFGVIAVAALLSAQNVTPSPGGSYTVGDPDFASIGATGPTIQVLRIKVVSGVTAYFITPQGVNVSALPITFPVANQVPSASGFFQTIIYLIPIDPSKPMTPSAPLIATVPPGTAATAMH